MKVKTTLVKYHYWRAILAGPERLLKQLATIFCSGSTRIQQEGAEFVLYSDTLDLLTSPDAAENEVDRIIERCVAVANLFAFETGDIKIVSMACVSPVHPHHGYGFGPITKIRVIGQDASEIRAAHIHSLQMGLSGRIIQLAASDDRVAEVLAAIGGVDPTWAAVYTVLEAVAKDLKPVVAGKAGDWSAIADCGWATETDLKDLKQTTNAHRHARGNPLPTKAPTVHEAQGMTRTIVREWLKRKATAA